MSKTVKIWLIIASVLVVLGLVIFAGVMFAYDWDFSKLSTVTYKTNTYEVSKDFDDISINMDTTDITFVPTDDGVCRVVCHELEKVKHSVAVKDGLLTISTIDTRKWYDHIGIYLGTLKMTVYLPNDKYNDISIETDTGDVLIPKDFAFDTLEIAGDTADIDCFAAVSEEVKIKLDTGYVKMDGITDNKIKLSTTTGSIILNSVTVNGNVDVQTNTGKINLTDVLCSNLRATSNTGKINLENIVASGEFSIVTDTGDVNFNNSDAQEIFVETDTGDVKGNLLTDKVFITRTDTGRVNTPKTTTGGRCEITTDTGDIILVTGN